MSFQSYIQGIIQDSIDVKQQLLASETLLSDIESSARICLTAYQRGNKILIAGNGGSAADAQHIAAELVARFERERPGLPAIALNTDTSMLTAIGNDYGFAHVFRRQVEAQAQPGDVFIGLSTSGNSGNILAAIEVAKEKGLHTIGLSGASGGAMAEQCNLCLCVPSTCTARIQESHIMVGHILCGLIEQHAFNGDDAAGSP